MTTDQVIKALAGQPAAQAMTLRLMRDPRGVTAGCNPSTVRALKARGYRVETVASVAYTTVHVYPIA